MKSSVSMKHFKLFDFKIVFQDLNQENKYKHLKEVFLRNLFENSIKIIKNYVQKLDKEKTTDDILDTIYKQILNELNNQNLKQIEDIHLLSIVLKSIKDKLNEMNNDYLNNSLITIKDELHNEKFILINQIFEKDSVIKKLKIIQKNCFEESREIYLNYELYLKNLMFLNNQNQLKEKKIKKKISKKKISQSKTISNIIHILNKKIQVTKNKQKKENMNKGFMFNLFNERSNIIYKVNVNNDDSDFSNCSSLDSTFNFEDYLNNDVNFNDECLSYEEYNKSLSPENDLNEFSNIKYHYLNIKKKNIIYKKQINTIKKLIKRMKNQVKQLNNIIELSKKNK